MEYIRVNCINVCYIFSPFICDILISRGWVDMRQRFEIQKTGHYRPQVNSGVDMSEEVRLSFNKHTFICWCKILHSRRHLQLWCVEQSTETEFQFRTNYFSIGARLRFDLTDRGGRLNIKMYYQYRDRHVKDKTVSYLTWDLIPGKDGLYTEMGPRIIGTHVCFCILDYHWKMYCLVTVT